MLKQGDGRCWGEAPKSAVESAVSSVRRPAVEMGKLQIAALDGRLYTMLAQVSNLDVFHTWVFDINQQFLLGSKSSITFTDCIKALGALKKLGVALGRMNLTRSSRKLSQRK